MCVTENSARESLKSCRWLIVRQHTTSGRGRSASYSRHSVLCSYWTELHFDKWQKMEDDSDCFKYDTELESALMTHILEETVDKLAIIRGLGRTAAVADDTCSVGHSEQSRVTSQSTRGGQTEGGTFGRVELMDARKELLTAFEAFKPEEAAAQSTGRQTVDERLKKVEEERSFVQSIMERTADEVRSKQRTTSHLESAIECEDEEKNKLLAAIFSRQQDLENIRRLVGKVKDTHDEYQLAKQQREEQLAPLKQHLLRLKRTHQAESDYMAASNAMVETQLEKVTAKKRDLDYSKAQSAQFAMDSEHRAHEEMVSFLRLRNRELDKSIQDELTTTKHDLLVGEDRGWPVVLT